jgi:ankyrin repeat protein
MIEELRKVYDKKWIKYQKYPSRALDEFFAWIDAHPELLLSINDRGWNCIAIIIAYEKASNPIAQDSERIFKYHLVNYLIQKGANPHQVSNSGVSLLHSALSRNYPGICELLLKKGVNPNIQCKGKTSLELCKDDSCRFLIEKHMKKH